MNCFVPRTCTEISEDSSPVNYQSTPNDSNVLGDVLAGEDSTDWTKVLVGEGSRAGSEHARTLEDFRESDAYVLLGAPGAGKTTLFEAEGRRAGCQCVTARDFLTFDVEDRPEWRNTTLFIDGLDEKRAGSPDGRTPLDGIRARLDALGRPRYRLSCREADWFGANDRIHLKTVSKDGKVRVLRLDPLSDESIRELLNHHTGIEDAGEFVAAARERGIDFLLTNPQSLRMLADVVAGGTWPETRMETFELACEKLVQEFNHEHQLASRDRPGTVELLAAAGRLCAIQLLAGHTGFALACDGGDSDYLGLQHIPGADREILRQTLRTRLFESPEPEEIRRAPAHRQVAEFLAAGYLSDLIDGGLPVRRVLALMTGEDGGIVSELRGLSAWLAAHSETSRNEIIERDPGGTIAYGDASTFTPDEKRRLLERLGPLDQSLDASLFISLTTADMALVLREYLTERKQDSEHQNRVVFLLCVLANAPPLPELRDVFLGLATSEDRSPRSRQWAAICLAKGALAQPDRFGEALRRLLTGLRHGHIRDEERRMSGTLLGILYPTFITPDEVFDYLDEKRGGNRQVSRTIRTYDNFWRHDLARMSRPEDAVVVLDTLADIFERSEGWKLGGEPPALVPARAVGALVQKALCRADDHDLRRTLRWLRLVGGDDEVDPDSVRAIRDWIEDRLERYKELLRESIAQCLESPDFDACKWRAKRPLHSAKAPSDYGRWCLGELAQAVYSKDLTQFWFEEAWYAFLHDNGADGLTLEHLEDVAATNTHLARVFDGLRSTDIHSQLARAQRRDRERSRERRREREQALANRRLFFRPYEEALRDNRCPAAPLNTIAEAHWGHYPDFQGENGRERLRKLLGDDALFEAAMDGLRSAIHRSDLPTPAQVLALRSDGRRHPLAFPVLAGLELIAPDEFSRLDVDRLRLAIAFLLAERPNFPEPGWLGLLVDSHPNLAAEEIVRFAMTELRRGERYISFVYEMSDNEWLSEVARTACPRLLNAFSVRAPRYLSDVLNRLLWSGIGNLDASTMEAIITRKLAAKSMTQAQRAHWLAAQLVASTGPDLVAVEDFAGAHENAMAGFFTFYERPSISKLLLDRLSSLSLGRLARLLGVGRRHLSAVRSEPAKFRESDLVRFLIEALGTRSDDKAVSALAELASDPGMAAWHSTIRRVQEEQQVIRRDARYRYPDINKVCQTLECRHPANSADLAALTCDLITAVSRKIRDGNTNDWRQYWNVDIKLPWKPRYEDDCRDALLSDLQTRLGQFGIDAEPEGRYAEEKRSDIRISYREFNVPVEIKKSSSRELWSAIRNQLIAKYTRDPGAGGYGIYLVFWFGNEPKPCQMPESGSRPRSAAELEERLRGTLTSKEARLISVCVIDVARR